eukprot:8502404-Pyramimonas_sp.AAC.1
MQSPNSKLELASHDLHPHPHDKIGKSNAPGKAETARGSPMQPPCLGLTTDGPPEASERIR